MSETKAAIYTYSAMNQVDALRMQEQRIREYLADKDRLIVGVYNDCGPRPATGLSEVLQAAVGAVGEGGEITMFSFDRLARRAELWRERCEALWAAGVTPVFVGFPPEWASQETYRKLADFGAVMAQGEVEAASWHKFAKMK